MSEELPGLRLTQREFDPLPEYSCSIPTGTTIGKRWKRHEGAYDQRFRAAGGKPWWIIGEYIEAADPKKGGHPLVPPGDQGRPGCRAGARRNPISLQGRAMTDLLQDSQPAPARKIIKAHDIRQAILKRFAAPEYAVMFEVGDATGARHSRFADAVIMSLWPSRGLELHGVEIKVNAADWRREAADPRKAETIGAYCDRWWVFTSPGVIKDSSEVPPAWGWREFDGANWITKREAEKTTAKPIDRTFLAALLRRSDEERRTSVYQAAQEMIEADRAAFEKRVDAEAERRTRERKYAREALTAFEEASGLNLSKEWGGTGTPKEVGALVKVILESGIANSWQGLERLLKNTRDVADELERAMAASGLPFEMPSMTKEPKRRKAAS